MINGSKRLSGDVEVQGAKNSALPIIAAAVLTKGENVFHNCPSLSDVDVALRIIRSLGGKARFSGGALLINCDDIHNDSVPDALTREMRGSVVFLGALLARMGRVVLGLPGGCELGARPIDLHLRALRLMGAEISERGGVLECTADGGLFGADIALSFPSVGATENIILSAVTADGTTTITNAAREPEICDLCDYLNSAGAKIYGAGEGTVVIDGVKSLSAVSHTIIPDRIVAATLMSAAAATGSRITLKGIIPSHLGAVTPVFEEMGCIADCRGTEMRFCAPERLRHTEVVRTMPYPGFPTDAQAPLTAAAAVAKGTSVFVENIFESRYKHIGELIRLGADIKIQDRVAVINGVKQLYGARVRACDLRGAAALVTAALAAEGESEISGVRYLERGYEDFELTLSSLGADIKKL